MNRKQNECIHIGAAIERTVRGRMSIRSFAGMLNCDRSTVYAIFRRKSIDIERLGKISKILETDFIEIYYRNTDSEVRQTGQFDGNIEKK
jgi:hypothetical protein